MALQTQLVDVNFAEGIDTRKDDYLITGKFEKLVNVIRNKAGGVEKRNGFTTIDSSVNTKVFKAGDDLYSYDGTNVKKWNGTSFDVVKKGVNLTFDNKIDILDFNNPAIDVMDVYDVNGGTCILYAKLYDPSTTEIHYRIVDPANGNTLVDNSFYLGGNPITRVILASSYNGKMLVFIDHSEDGYVHLRAIDIYGVTSTTLVIDAADVVGDFMNRYALSSVCVDDQDASKHWVLFSADRSVNGYALKYNLTVQGGSISQTDTLLTNNTPVWEVFKSVKNSNYLSFLQTGYDTVLDTTFTTSHHAASGAGAVRYAEVAITSALYARDLKVYVNGILCYSESGLNTDNIRILITGLPNSSQMAVTGSSITAFYSIPFVSGAPVLPYSVQMVYGNVVYNYSMALDVYNQADVFYQSANSLILTSKQRVSSVNVTNGNFRDVTTTQDIVSYSLLTVESNKTVMYQARTGDTRRFEFDINANTYVMTVPCTSTIVSKVSNGRAIFYEQSTQSFLVVNMSDMTILSCLFFGNAYKWMSGGRIYPYIDFNSCYITSNAMIGRNLINGSTSLVNFSIAKVKQNNPSVLELQDQALLTGGVLWCVDRADVREVGFFGCPSVVSSSYSTTGGTLGNGKYIYCLTYSYESENGLYEESAPSAQLNITGTTATGSVAFVIAGLPITNRKKANLYVNLYRTQVNGSIFYRVAKVSISDNISITDTMSDGAITQYILYTTGGVLTNSPVGACRFLTATKNRVFTALVENPEMMLFSKEKASGYQYEMSQLQYIDCNGGRFSGDITDIFELDEKIIVSKSNYLLGIAGDGPNAAGGGYDFSIPQLISTDAGVSDDGTSVIVPNGVIFKTKKGIYILNRGLVVSYIGLLVEGYNSEKINFSIMHPTKTVVIFGTNNRIIVYDYFLNNWMTWEGVNAISGTFYNDNLHIVLANGKIMAQGSSYLDDGRDILTEIETSWLEVGSIQGFQRVKRLMILGHGYGASQATVKAFVDYETVNFKTHTMNVVETNGDSYQMNLHFAQQKGQTIKIKINEIASSVKTSFSGLTFVVGLKKGIFKTSTSTRI